MTEIAATRAVPATAAAPATIRGGHNAGLDLLRTVACLMVVAFHLRAVLGVDFGPANVLVNGGDAGVFVFFVLSGYLLYRPFVRGPVDLPSYALKRAARIVPGYLVALVCLTLLTRSQLPIQHPLPYLTLTSSYNTDLRAFLGNAWTLSAEVIFYVVLPVVARLIRGKEIQRLLLLGAISAGAGIAYRFDFGPGNEWAFGAFPFVAYAFVPGMLLAAVEVRRPELLRRLTGWWVPIVGIAFLALETQLRGYPFAFGAAVGTPLLIVWLRGVTVPFARALAFTGGASYALYLWHKDLLISFGLLGVGWVGLLIAIAGAAASWRFVERPILEFAHQTVARFRPARLVEAPVPAGLQ
jgi:peptidoglycan/LPS O-acetylase OafA/YrhL